MTEPVRLLEVLGSLSLACDAADGFPAEATMRSAVLAGQLAEGFGGAELVRDVIVGGLLRHIGCTGFAVEEARAYGAGDDVALRQVMAAVDFGQPERAVQTVTEQLATHAPAADRQAAIAALLGGGVEAARLHDAAQCDAGEHLAALLPVSDGSRSVAADAFERWDGHGGPVGKAGEEIGLVARLVEVAYVAELFRSRQGRGGALAELRLQAGGRLDPELVQAFLDRSDELFGSIDGRVPVWDVLLDLEPRPHTRIAPAQVRSAAVAFARFTDLKSTYFTGHSESVAAVAEQAGRIAGLPDHEVDALTLAALVHDIGRVGVPTGTWELPRPLSRPEKDRLRFHSWETQRILEATPLFVGLAPIAGATHERTDGSGYHRGLSGPSVALAARLLAAADVAVALGESRPHRPARSPLEVGAVLREHVTGGTLDRVAVNAVFEARAEPPVATSRPGGLTDREIEVVGLLATGASNKDIARALGITAKTVAHHVAHAYDKTGARSRAGMTLYAIDHGVVARNAAPPRSP